MLMRKSGLLRPTLYALFLVALLAGCGSNPFNPDDIIDDDNRLPDDTPINDTPQNLMLRFEAAYERKVPAEYEKLLTSDFRFTFSSISDPGLASDYDEGGWGKDDEIESTNHLFTGFVNDVGVFHGPAESIDLTLGISGYPDDPARPDSGAFYKLVIAQGVNLLLTISGADGYQVEAPQDFYIVRGDVAQLDAGQEATANRWYIYRWDDKSTEPPATTGGAPRLASLDASGQPARLTWGFLKSSYVETP